MNDDRWERFFQWEKNCHDAIDVKKIYLTIAGDLVAGFLLSQIIYWYLPGKGNVSKLRVRKFGEYWLAKKRSDWKNEICISPKQFDRAIEELRKKGLVKTKIFKFDGSPMVHIQVNIDSLMIAINQYYEQKINDKLPKEEEPIYPKVNNQITQEVTSLTKNTTKITNIDKHLQCYDLPRQDRISQLKIDNEEEIYSLVENLSPSHSSFPKVWYDKIFRHVSGWKGMQYLDTPEIRASQAHYIRQLFERGYSPSKIMDLADSIYGSEEYFSFNQVLKLTKESR